MAITYTFNPFTSNFDAVTDAPIVTDWVPYTPTITGFGTATGVVGYSRRVGDSLQVRATFTSGTSTAVEGRIALGFNGTSGNVTTSVSMVAIEYVGGAATNVNAAVSWNMLGEPSVAYLTFGQGSGSSAGLTKKIANTFLSSGDTISFTAQVPIDGW